MKPKIRPSFGMLVVVALALVALWAVGAFK